MDGQSFHEDRQPRPPLESFLLAYAATVPPALCAAALVLPTAGAAWAVRLGIVWSGGLLCFFAGVHRGLSFRQPGGARLAQLGSTLWLFSLGVISVVSPWPAPALALQLAGFVSLAVLDPLAAIHREAPRYFARLRPMQLLIPVASLLVLLAQVLHAYKRVL